MRLILMIIVVPLLMPLSSLFIQAPEPVSASAMDRTVLAMGTELRLHLEGSGDLGQASEAALTEAARIEAACSTWNPGSSWSRLNASQGTPVTLAKEWIDLLGQIQTWNLQTEGAFDRSAE